MTLDELERRAYIEGRGVSYVDLFRYAEEAQANREVRRKERSGGRTI
jgi:hypothetical protein